MIQYKKAMIRAIGLAVLFLFLSVLVAGASETAGTLCTGVNCSTEGTVIVAPTASPAAGSYTSAQSVTLTATGASSIRYTTSGTAPTCSSGTLYAGAISVSSSQTIKSIACYPNSNSSSVASYSYTITVVSSTSGSHTTGGSGGGGSTTPPVATTTPSTAGTGTNTTASTLGNLIALLKVLIAQAQAQGIQIPVAATALVSGNGTTPTPLGPLTSGVSPNENITTPFTQSLSFGLTGSSVTRLQTFLKNQGSAIYPEGLITGYFGQATLRAVQRFQVQYNIAHPGDTGYGLVGPATRAKINALLGL